MIEYDYTIKRNEEDEVVVYSPDKIPKQLPNLIYLEGPNSSGKSTLLNMIALGLHGLKKENLNPALKHKMESILDTSYQEVKFEFKIQNKDATLEIISLKEDSTESLIKVYEVNNGQKISISPERFERDYNLIYDIPDNPTQRLNQLTESIKWLQQSRGNRTSSLTSHIQGVINDVKNSKDPERIKTLQEELKKAKKYYEDLFEENNENEIFFDILEKYTYCRSFLDYYNLFEQLEKIVKELEKNNKKVKRVKKKKNHKYEALISEANEILEILQARYDQATPTLKRLISKENDHLIRFWEKVNFKDYLRNLEFSETFKKVLLTFKTILFSLVHDEKHEKILEEAKIWGEIIDILEECETKDIVVPGIGKKISEFIDSLKEANSDNENLLNYISNINNLIDLLDKMDENRNRLENIFEELGEIDQESGWFEDEIDTDYELEKAIEKQKEIQYFLDHYMKECAKKDIGIEEIPITFDKVRAMEEINPYISYSENQLLEKITHLQNYMHDQKIILKKKYNNIILLEKEIDRLGKKEPHKYQDKIEELTELLRISQILKQKLVKKYDSYINDLINRKYSQDSKDNEREKYFELVSDYLGRRIGYIKYVDKDYKVISIDMVKGIIRTEEGKIIRLDDMGTGQGQSAYLMGLLNVSDNRKIIALLDEVAMMDKKSLSPIFKKLKELHDQDKLLLGIVVQMGNELKIDQIGA